MTTFFNPREQYIAQTLAHRYGVHMQKYGGYEQAEQQRILFYPDYYEPKISDFELSVLSLKYATKFNQLKHPNILGALLHQGIKREHIGDIITDGDHWQIIVSRHLSDYITMQVTKIGRVPVTIEEIDVDALVIPIDNKKSKYLTVSSFRLDNIVANVYNISRQEAKRLIEHEKCKVNFSTVTKPDAVIHIHDMISLRRFGRCYITAIGEETRKHRYPITVSVLQNKN